MNTSTSNLTEVVQFLRSKGLSNYAVAGIIGNLEVESSFNPDAYNANEGAIGIAQWEGGRRTALQSFASAHGGSETNLGIQLQFLWHELTTSYTNVLHSIQRAGSATEAARIWDVGVGGVNSGTGFENSSGSADQTRQQDAYTFNHGGTLASSSNGGGGSSPDSFTSSLLPSGGGGGGSLIPDATSGTGGNQKLDYKSLGSLLDSIPALEALVDKAQAQGWNLDTFQNQVQDSAWWKAHSDTARQFILLGAQDPSTAQQQLHNLENHITLLSNQLGMPLNATELQGIATTAIMSGNDTSDQWITMQIGDHENYSHLKSTSGLAGGMAATVGQLQQMAADYGMNWNPSQLAQRAQAVVEGKTTIDTYQNNLKTWAESAFPGLAKDIQSGQTVSQLASPYMQSMSQLLEVDPGTLNTYTPLIRQAMQGTRDPKSGVAATTPLWQFEQQVRSDPRWQYTQNAKDTMSTALLKIGADFGFGPNG